MVMLEERATASEEHSEELERELEAEALKTKDAEQRARVATERVAALQQQLSQHHTGGRRGRAYRRLPLSDLLKP